jgi:hypothetical protein
MIEMWSYKQVIFFYIIGGEWEEVIERKRENVLAKSLS